MVKEGDNTNNDCGADAKHLKWLLDAIAKIKYQKQRPNEERICNILQSNHKVSREDVLEYLKVAVKDGGILQVHNKGMVSYKDPSTVSQLQTRSLDVSPRTDLIKIMIRSIRELGETNGTTLRSLENYIKSSYSVHLKEGANLTLMLKMQAKRAVAGGMLRQEGANFKVALTKPVKKTDLLSSISKTRVTVDVEDIGVGPIEVILPFERNKVSSVLATVVPVTFSCGYF